MADEQIDGEKPPKRRGRISGTRILKVADKGLLGAFIGAIIAVYILDAIFFMAWAPDIWLMPVFLLIGVTIRSVGVFTGPIMQLVAKDQTIGREAKTIRALSVAAGIICLIPALSFFAGGHYNQTHSSTVAVATEAVSDTNKVARIQTLRDQVTRIEKDRDASIEETNKTIDAIVDDGVPGISNADNDSIARLRTEIQGYRNTATDQINSIETQIGSIEQEKETIQTTSAAEQARVSPANAIFEVLGGITGGARIWAMTILFLFAILIEAIAFFGLGAYQGLHKFFVEAIQRMELEELAHEGRLVAERTRQLALAEEEIALIALRTAETRARTEAMMSGQEGETFDAIRAAERNLKRAEANALISDILRRAHEAEVGPVVSVAPRPVWVEPPPEPISEPPIELELNEPLPLPPEPEPAPAVTAEPERSSASQRARDAALAGVQYRAANKAKAEAYIIVPSLVARDAELQAAKVAAQ
jgi:hypothetical protein